MFPQTRTVKSSDEFSDGSEDPGVGLEGSYNVAKNLAELYSYPSVLWKVELVSEKIGYLTEEIPMYSVEREAYFLPSQQEQRLDYTSKDTTIFN